MWDDDHYCIANWETDRCFYCNDWVEAPKPKPRQPRIFKWAKQNRPMKRLAANIIKEGDSPMVGTMSDCLGIDLVEEQAAYDDFRRYVVLEKVVGVEWAVVDSETTSTMKAGYRTLNDAIEWCKLFNESEERYESGN